MTVSTSLANAFSGLTAAARAAEVVSANVANAMTEGYGRRVLEFGAPAAGGGGVRIIGVERLVAEGLLADRRLAEAAAAGARVGAEFLARIETRFGRPDEAGSVGAKLAGLEAALLQAAARPDSAALLSGVLEAAKGVAATIAAVGEEVQAARAEADRAIARDVELLNATLGELAELNARIGAASAAGRDVAALQDQRQALVDRIAAILPVREVARENGAIALYTEGGASLLEGKPARFGFTPTGVVTADMTGPPGGALSGLTLNGLPIPVSGGAGPVAGGRLGALFDLRDRLAPEAQGRLDALARDLLERFAGPAADPTLAPGAPGLFTDAGGPFAPAAEAGLALRLRVNEAADPARGGALWRLRDGLGAAAPGPEGAGGQLARLAGRLAEPRVPASGGLPPSARSAAGLAGEVLSLLSSARLSAETQQGFAASRADALRGLERERGVDTDAELQALLVIERAYAANARVLQAADGMLRALLEI